MDIASAKTPASTPVPAEAAEAALDRLLELIIKGFFVLTDGQGALSKWSEPAEMLFGHAAEEALGEPFFGSLAEASAEAPQVAAWKGFIEAGDAPEAPGRIELAARKPGGGTFPLEAVFVPVKLEEGFDFSLFLEDLSFELPLDLMLLRMRQQHPVVVKALRAALDASPQRWEGGRTAGTLVAFRALAETPWIETAMRRREEAAAAAEAEIQSRIQMYEVPDVQGTDVYDLEDARAVIDRLKWATDRIEELEERSRIMENAAQEAADARVRAEAAERAALDAKAEVADAIAERPVDSSGEAERLELIARIERLEHSGRSAPDPDRLAAIERAGSDARAAVEAARAELAARMDALERSRGGDADGLRAELADLRARADEALSIRREIDLLGQGVQETAELRAQLERLTARVTAADSELAALRDRPAAPTGLEDLVQRLRERTDDAEQALRAREEHERVALRDAEAARTELRAALERVEQISEETARLRAQIASTPEEAVLSEEDRRRVEAARREADEARAGLETIRAQADELRAQTAALREESGRLQARLHELEDGDGRARHDVDALRREQEQIRALLEDARRERDDARAQVRDAVRAAEEARVALEREARERPVREAADAAQASESEVSEFVNRTRDEIGSMRLDADAVRARLDALAAETEDAVRRADEARAEATAARGDAAAGVEEARDALRAAHAASDRVDMIDRGAGNVIAEVRGFKALVEEMGALARAAQIDATESRADAGEARGVVARLEKIVTAAREQAELARGEAAGAHEHAAAAAETAESLRELAAGAGEAARAAALEAVREEAERLAAELRDGAQATALDLSPLEERLAALEAVEPAVATPPVDLSPLEERLAALEAVEPAVATPPVDLSPLEERLTVLESADPAGDGDAEARIADMAAELMVARTETEQARDDLEALRGEMTALREYAAAARTEATAAHEAATVARKGNTAEERRVVELETEIKALRVTLQELRTGFDEARQASVAARRDAEAARSAAERVGQASEASQQKFSEAWKKMLSSGRPGMAQPAQPGMRPKPLSKPPAAKKEAPPARTARAGFDDQSQPMALLDLDGRFKELNPPFTKLVGYKEHEFGKATWPSVLDRAVYKAQQEELGRLASGEVESIEVQSSYMHAQGLMVPITGELKLVRDDAGAPGHLLLVTEDRQTS